MTEKESVIGKLLSTGTGSTGIGPLIQVIGEEPPKPETIKEISPQKEDEVPSMLEMMIAAQKEAAKEKEKQQETDIKKSAKQGFTGFKKGFFGNEKKTSISKAKKVTNTTDPMLNKEKTDIIEVRKKPEEKKNNFVIDEVQQALEEDQHPLVQKIKQNEWVTPDLMEKMKNNTILTMGFRNPDCMEAVQLMQKNPKEAQKKYQNNPLVTNFLQEFGKFMVAHFESLSGKPQNPGQNDKKPINSDIKSDSPQVIRELGPLEQQAWDKKRAQIKKKEKEKAVEVLDASKQQNMGSPEDEKVQKILQNEELRNLLMDPNMQKILMECSDPIKFQQHMRNPEIMRKIGLLQSAGLVATAK